MLYDEKINEDKDRLHESLVEIDVPDIVPINNDKGRNIDVVVSYH